MQYNYVMSIHNSSTAPHLSRNSELKATHTILCCKKFNYENDWATKSEKCKHSVNIGNGFCKDSFYRRVFSHEYLIFSIWSY